MSAHHSIAVAPLTVGRYLLAMAIALCLIEAGGAQRAKRAAPVATPVQSEAPAMAASYTAAFDAWRAANDPQAAILVVRRGGKTLFTRGYNANPDEPTLIGSLSKAITGACLTTLIRDGKLSFITSMREALADFFRNHGRALDPRFENVTVEQLLTHRSGLHDHGDGDPLVAIRRERIAQRLTDIASPQPQLATYLAQNRLVSVPLRLQ